MLSFDVLTLLALAATVAAVLFRREPLQGRQRYVAWAALALAGVHFFLLRRPTFFPAYGVAVALIFTLRPQTYGSFLLRRAMGVASVLALLAVAALGWAFPLIQLPAPTGPHVVGSRWLAVVDSSRREDFVADPAARRALLLRFWYPADSTAPTVAPMMTAPQGRVVAKAMGLPAFALQHLATTATHSHAEVALSARQDTWPVVLFSHGFGIGYESQNTVQMEELASQGYVVVSIDHPHEAGVVAFPNGPVIPMAPDTTLDPAAAAKAAPLMSVLASATDTVAVNQATDGMRNLMRLDRSMDRWVQDTRFVADLLAQWDSVAPFPGFAGRLRTDQLGVFGMSFGGATAASFCVIDPRCAVGINLDGLTFGAGADSAIRRPFLFATSGTNPHMYDTEFQRASGPTWLVNVAGANHLDFTDFGFVSPLFVRLGVLGGIPASRMREIMNAAVLGMMDAHLTARRPLADTALARFPEVRLRSRPGVSPPPG